MLPALPSVTRRRRVQQSSVASSPELVEDAKIVSKSPGKRKTSKQIAAAELSAVADKAKLANSELLLKALKKILGQQMATSQVSMASSATSTPTSAGLRPCTRPEHPWPFRARKTTKSGHAAARDAYHRLVSPSYILQIGSLATPAGPGKAYRTA